MSSGYVKGDLVQNHTVGKQSLGVLLTPEDTHPHFWKVLSVKGVESWFEFNLTKLAESKDET